MLRTFMLGLLIVFASLPCLAQEVISLRPNAQIERPSIRLGDVFENIAAEKNQDIAVSPAPGKSIVYDVRTLTQLARQHGLAWQPRSALDKSVLTRTAQPLSMDKVGVVVLQKIAEQTTLTSNTTEIVWDNRLLSILVPAGAPQDFALENFTYDEQNQRFRSDLVAQTGGDPIRKPLSGRLIVKHLAPVLAKRLAAGTVIGERDLDWISVRQDQTSGDILTQRTSLIGQELRHDTAEGQLLRARDVAPPRLVTRGMLVSMRVETPLMMITTQGRAMQDGAKGDVVRVTNTQSNRVVEGVVEADGAIRISALQKVAAVDSKKE